MSRFGLLPKSHRLKHRFCLIVHTEALESAQHILRCAAFDARVQLSMQKMQKLASTPLQWMLTGEFTDSLERAAQLLNSLVLYLRQLQVEVPLIRVEILTTSCDESTSIKQATGHIDVRRGAIFEKQTPITERIPCNL